MRKMTIEQLLTWAFTEELCKAQGGGRLIPAMQSASAIYGDIETLGTLIDRSPNGWGVIPTWSDVDEPHADALKVGQAVKALTKDGFDIPVDWYPFPEWSDERGLIRAEVDRVLAGERARGERQTGRHAYNLIVTCAVLKRGPDWRADRPKERMVEHNGMPAWFVMKRFKDAFGKSRMVEVDGRDKRSRRPVKGAYRKYVLSDPLRGAILSRLDWMVWQAALKLLDRELDHTLSFGNTLPMRFDPAPWVGKFQAVLPEQSIDKAG
ncbi:hypothetical protein [Martelella endophytica]|uniref:Uncharacterized protein n=1 Tax=Martelella endophytica TaxID=1486262 RepID=A0A0D5LL29_MAREN|nr:hypothetical protein [Martelella endophytica]AJY44675.1 hypothetical protein TM49_01630 [Martelella endophytica]